MSKSRVRAMRGVVVVAALSLVGLVGGPAVGAAETFPTVDQPGVTAKEIKVGGVVTASNDPTGGKLDTAYDGVKAYFDYINSKGGVYGRKLVLDAKHDDQLANNRSEVQSLLTNDDVFAALPIATQLYTGSKLLADAGVPTYGWDINEEWGSENHNPGPSNFFTNVGDYICFTCATAGPQSWLPKKLNRHRIGNLAFNVSQSTSCADGLEKSLAKYKTGKIVFQDKSLAFGTPDYSAQVAQMKEKNVDLVITCIDGNGAATLAREMKKQGLNVPQILPNSYNAGPDQEERPGAERELSLHDLHPVRDEPRAAGPQELPEVDQEERRGEDRELAAGLDQRGRVRDRPQGRRPELHAAEGRRRHEQDHELHRGRDRRADQLDDRAPEPDRLLRGAEGRRRQVQAAVRQEGQAVPVLPRRVEDDAQAAAGQLLTQRGPEGRRSPKE